MVPEKDKNKISLLSYQNNPESQTVVTINDFQNVQTQLTPLQKLIDKVGGEHSYQFKSVVIFNLMWFLTSWMLVGQGFFFDPRYQCPDNITQCQDYICKQVKPEDRLSSMKWHAQSIVFEFPDQLMICEQQYLQPVLTSLIYAGSLIGFFIIPYVADNFGRRLGIRISWAFFVLGLFFFTIAHSSYMIGIGQLLIGFGCNPAITLCYSFLNEQVIGDKRQKYGLFIQIALAIGQCTIAFMFLPDYGWRTVIYILLGLVFFNQILLQYLVESPKFLISKSKVKALQALNYIAQQNKRQKIELKQLEAIQTISDQQSQGASIVDLFKYKSLFWSTVAGGLVFLAIQVIYYGTLLNFDQIGFSKLLNQEMVGISQCFGYIAAQLVINKISRKKWSMIGLGLSSIFCFLLALVGSMQNQSNLQIIKIIQTIFLMLNRFILCGFWGLFYVYVAQMYPTKVRSLGFGWTSAMGTVGSTLAPFIIYGSKSLNINSWIAPGVIGILGFISIFKLKETFKKPSYDDIQQVRLKGRWKLSDDQVQTAGTKRKTANQEVKKIDISIQ